MGTFRCLGGWCVHSLGNFLEKWGNTLFQQSVALRPASKVATLRGAPSPSQEPPQGQPSLLVPGEVLGSQDILPPPCPPPPGLTSTAQAACRASRAIGPPSRCPLTDGLPQCPARLATTGATQNHWPLVHGNQPLPGVNRTAGRALFIGAACPDVGLLAVSQIGGSLS